MSGSPVRVVHPCDVGDAVELEVSGLAAGMYQVVLHTARSTTSGRLNVVR